MYFIIALLFLSLSPGLTLVWVYVWVGCLGRSFSDSKVSQLVEIQLWGKFCLWNSALLFDYLIPNPSKPEETLLKLREGFRWFWGRKDNKHLKHELLLWYHNQEALRCSGTWIGGPLYMRCMCVLGCAWGSDDLLCLLKSLWWFSLLNSQVLPFTVSISSLHKLMLFPNIPKLRTIPKFPKLRTPQLHKREEKSVSSEDGKGGIPLCTVGAHSCPPRPAPSSSWRETM